MKRLLSPWWALLSLAALLWTFSAPPQFLESIKLNYFDTLITEQEPVENNIYTVYIDEPALDKYGQYPFPRNIYADIITQLYDNGAGLVVWNIMMPEVDRLGGDQTLHETMLELPVILASRPSNKTKNEPINPGAVIVNSEYLDRLLPYPGIIANTQLLENASVGAGIVSVEPEIDGVVRRMPTVAVVDGVLYPSLALEVLRVIANDPNFQIKLNEFGVEKMRIPQFGTIPTDSEGRVWIDWSQRSKGIGLTQLDNTNLEGAVVIVDVTAAGIANPVPTAMGAKYPGQVQAAVIATMFNGTNIQRPDWAPSAELLALGVGGLLLILLSRWMIVGLLTTVALIGGVIPYSIHMFTTEKFLLDVTAPTITFVLIALHVYGIKFVREFLEKQAIKKQFEGYCSPEVVRLLQEQPDLIKMGIKQEISIVMSDLRGFTPLGESFGDDVQGLTELMNDYMDTISEPVIKDNGMIIKYIGDASMHIHGAPMPDPNHAKHSVETVVSMLEQVNRFNNKLKKAGKPEIAMGLGVNTGYAFIGEIGSTARHSYDILGDSVSTAARLEGQSKAYGVKVIIGPETYEKTKHDFFYLELDEMAVKGKTEGLRIYTLGLYDRRVGEPEDTHYEERKADRDLRWEKFLPMRVKHNEMLKLYRKQRFDDAIQQCKELKGSFEGMLDDYYTMWIERCEYMKTVQLDESWDGIYRATSK